MLSCWERRCAPGACVHTGVMMGAGRSGGRHSPTPSPDTGTGVTRRSPRTKGNQSPRSARRGLAPALRSSPQRQQGLWSPLAWPTAYSSPLGLSFNSRVRSPGGWHHT